MSEMFCRKGRIAIFVDFNNESFKIETDDAIVITYSFMASLKKTFYQNINI
jgi:hypothetical protein